VTQARKNPPNTPRISVSPAIPVGDSPLASPMFLGMNIDLTPKAANATPNTPTMICIAKSIRLLTFFNHPNLAVIERRELRSTRPYVRPVQASICAVMGGRNQVYV